MNQEGRKDCPPIRQPAVPGEHQLSGGIRRAIELTATATGRPADVGVRQARAVPRPVGRTRWGRDPAMPAP